MSKKVLGRGLGELLPDRGAPVSRESASLPRSKDPTDLGPGLRVLVLQKNGTAPKTGAASTPNRGPDLLLVKLSLVLADACLVGMVFIWRRYAATPMLWTEAAICTGIILFAAWLTCLAAWLHFHHE